MNKQLIREIHLWISLLLGVIIFLLCISGAFLVFKNEMRDMLGMPRVIGTHTDRWDDMPTKLSLLWQVWLAHLCP